MQCSILITKNYIKFKEKYHQKNNFLNIKSFLSLPLDDVIIATPNNTHTYYTNMALNAGKHVLCENVD